MIAATEFSLDLPLYTRNTNDFRGLEGIVEMCNGRYGWNKTVDDYLEMGKQVLRDERSFNKKAGFAEGSDDLPDFFRTEKLPPHNTVYDIPKEELNKVFNF